jgi:hypothetical protein
MTIRLGPISDSNDPWEARRQHIAIARGIIVPDFASRRGW